MTIPTQPPTSEERLLAALAHFIGLFVALLIWAIQKDKSPFVRFHTLQVMFFDLGVIIVTFLAVGLTMGCILLTFLAGLGTSSSSILPGDEGIFEVVFFFFPFLIMLPVIILNLIITILRFVAAITVLQGQNFRYPWLGQQVEKFLAD